MIARLGTEPFDVAVIGGGVNGAPGYIAANAIADDLRLKRPWSPVPPPEWKH